MRVSTKALTLAPAILLGFCWQLWVKAYPQSEFFPAANIHLARSQLEPQGYEILTATSALEGMALARRAKPDLIVSDVHMPHHDGYDFQSMVQADPELAQIPFVFLSSSVWSIREKETALTRGARKFISRPIEPEALVAELEACLPPAKEARKAQGSGS